MVVSLYQAAVDVRLDIAIDLGSMAVAAENCALVEMC